MHMKFTAGIWLHSQSFLVGPSEPSGVIEVQAESTEKVHAMQKFKAKSFVIPWQLWPVLANSDYVRLVWDTGQSLTK